MISKDDFLASAVSIFAQYPTIAQLYQAQDPRVVAQVNAFANMLAMLSTDLEIQSSEPFQKSRDVTVLADASVRGILPFAFGKTVELLATNVGTIGDGSFVLNAGRVIKDTSGRNYVISQTNTIPKNTTGLSYTRTSTTVTVTFTAHGCVTGDVLPISSAIDSNLNDNQTITRINADSFTFETDSTGTSSGTLSIINGLAFAKQSETREVTHIVTASQPFYKILVPTNQDDTLKFTNVRLHETGGDEYYYKNDYLNVAVGDKVFHLETDENRFLFIKLGMTDIVGIQPIQDTSYTITIEECEGAYDIAAGTKFALDTVTPSSNEIGSKYTLLASTGGINPLDIATIREVINYPSIYDTSAVYLNNFDFLLRRNLSPFQFLSVWNEQTEENVRGANVDNINTIFIAAQILDDDDVYENEFNEQEAISGRTIGSEGVITIADDSYRVRYFSIIKEYITITITAYVAPIYDFGTVRGQIRQLILDEYDKDSAFAKRGFSRIKYSDIYDLITENVIALQKGGVGDMTVSIDIIGNDDDIAKGNKSYTRSGTTVTVTFTAHGFVTDDLLFISESTDIGLNGSHLITRINDNTFTFQTTSTGINGTLSVLAKPRPEKWRFVDTSSLIVNIREAI